MLKFKKTAYITINNRSVEEDNESSFYEMTNEPHVPKGMWKKCDKCQKMLYTDDVINNNYVCSNCGNYFRIDAETRIKMIADKDSFYEWDRGIENKNPLNFEGYEEKIEGFKKKTQLDESVITGECYIRGEKTALGVCDAGFLMGSMGYVTGEKITRMVERATKDSLPIVIFACSGGARMQEGIISLMQMAKTSAAIKRHSDKGLLYITVLTDPTTGGVTASFAMLGDIILAEPGALIGFAGPRVIEQTIGQKLPDGFQRAEFLVEHGFVDRIVKREKLRKTLGKLIKVHNKPNNIEHSKEYTNALKLAIKNSGFGGEEIFDDDNKRLSAWEQVQKSRLPKRPTALDYIGEIFDGFVEMHGDRIYSDDKAIVGGLASIGGRTVTVIGEQKGRNTNENIERNFGMPLPEGYRKALRLMKQAEKFNRPIINLIDTKGAFCGIEAEERGQGEAIARNLLEMSALKVPVLSIIIGEGGSGGALALAVGNEVWIMENATYSVLSPEGFASILWKDSKKAEVAAEVMKMTSNDLEVLKVVDKIIKEPKEFDIESLKTIRDELKYNIIKFLENYDNKTSNEILEERYERFRGL